MAICLPGSPPAQSAAPALDDSRIHQRSARARDIAALGGKDDIEREAQVTLCRRFPENVVGGAVDLSDLQESGTYFVRCRRHRSGQQDHAHKSSARTGYRRVSIVSSGRSARAARGVGLAGVRLGPVDADPIALAQAAPGTRRASPCDALRSSRISACHALRPARDLVAGSRRNDLHSVRSKRRADRAEPAFTVVLEYMRRQTSSPNSMAMPCCVRQRQRRRQHGRIAQLRRDPRLTAGHRGTQRRPRSLWRHARRHWPGSGAEQLVRASR